MSWVLARRFGPMPAIAAAAALVVSPPLLEVSRIADIDHHYLEPPLLAALVAATLGLRRGADAAGVLRRGVVFGLALAAALFVQTAFLLAAAAAFAAVFFVLHDEDRTLAAAATGFGLAALLVGLYRVTRPPGYPDSEWFLGAPHVAALLAAAVACGGAARRGRGAQRQRSPHQEPWRGRGAALLAGVASAACVPGALESFARGARFFGGDPWLRTIEEFRPLFAAEDRPVSAFLFLLGGGALLLVPFAIDAVRSGRRGRRAVALFAVVYVAAAIASRRFTIPTSALLALVSAAVVADLAARGRRLLSSAAAALAILPALAGALPGLAHPPPVVDPRAEPMLRVAQELRARRDGGRVLGPWAWGHLFDVAGGHPVVVDNFGAMPSRSIFEGALRARVADEEALAAYCVQAGVRYVVLENPLVELPRTVEMAGLPLDAYLRPPAAPGGAHTFTRKTVATFWWRAYYGGPIRAFRLVYRDPEPSDDPPPYRGPRVELWELTR